MRRALLVVVVVVAACVPAGNVSEDEEPAGGLEVSLTPSAATKGVPFAASGGWTVTIDEFAIFATLDATHTIFEIDGTQRNVGSGSTEAKFLVPGPGCSMRATAITAGPGSAGVEIGINGLPPQTDAPPCNVDAATLARFGQQADNDPFLADSAPPGPNMIIRAHAERGGQHVDLDLALAGDPASMLPQPVTVVANEGLPLAYPIYAEAVVDVPVGVSFDKIAAADTDGDGHITVAELGVIPDADQCDPSKSVCAPLLDLIALVNCSYIFGNQVPVLSDD